ncbi:MAG: proline dehydrogenase [Flavobacteriales bacterium]|nr:proline dehydrogenase [Flavobacteriales bacterium]|tara:strand:- start:11117 stop:12271 length:1155 start_codon:yes stop_codon:yes gene_type:complete
MIFEDKYIDYSYKKKTELYQTLILFYIISNRSIVQLGKFLLNVALILKLPILGIIKKTIFKQFCGGENIDESKIKINQLGKHNIKTILDYSVEGNNDSSSIEKTFLEIISNINEAKHNPLLPFCVFKITGIAPFHLLKKINNSTLLSKEEEKLLTSTKFKLDKICKTAQNCKTPILIDAEESWIQNAIDKLTEDLMKKYNKNFVLIYNTIQLYRRDKLEYIYNLHNDAKRHQYKLGLKLVRGAYMEKEEARARKKKYKSPIHLSKKDCDNDFNIAIKYCINNIENISLCIGTHNELSTEYALKLMQTKKIKCDDPRIYFSQLLGMSDNISYHLSKLNYNVAKYVPYGPVKKVIPYLIRRAEENSAITAQTREEIKRIKNVLKSG